MSAVVADEAVGTRTSAMADATPIAFGLFAFALVIYGVRFVAVDAASIQGATSEALNYAILVAGVAELGFFCVFAREVFTSGMPAHSQ